MENFLVVVTGLVALSVLIYMSKWIGKKSSSKEVNRSESKSISSSYTKAKGKKEKSKRSKDRKIDEDNRSSKNRNIELDEDLYRNLKKWRNKIVEKEGKYKSKVFSDSALERIAKKKPTNKSSLRYTKGVGPKRANKYGKGVLSIIPKEEKRRRKRESKKIKDVIESEGIDKLYHFTDKANLHSIRVNGGLYSWYHCRQNEIEVDRPGGNQVSRRLDREKDLEDYVRLSFVKRPPMYYVAQRDGRIQNPVILEISPEVILWEATLFSDGNAIADRSKIGGKLEDLSQIRFDILRQSDWTNESEKHYWQAEVLVKNHVPLRHMSNYL